jgi:hypothetical protein
MSEFTIVSSAVEHIVWVQIEGYDKMFLSYEPHTTVMEIIKQRVLKDNRYKYRAYFLGQYVLPEAYVPDETTPEEPVVFKLIKNRRSKCFILV